MSCEPKTITEKQRELFRLQAQAVLAEHRAGRKIERTALQWAKAWAHSVRDEDLPPALRGGALEAF